MEATWLVWIAISIRLPLLHEWAAKLPLSPLTGCGKSPSALLEGSVSEGRGSKFRTLQPSALRPPHGLLLLRGLFAHGAAEEFGQCGIEGGAC
jgi:hypothetical protein